MNWKNFIKNASHNDLRVRGVFFYSSISSSFSETASSSGKSDEACFIGAASGLG